MKLRNLRNERQPKLMIIPMIDIIFFLLVFFMMSSLSMVTQKTIPLALPQASSGKLDVRQSIAIAVTASGKIMFEQEEIPPSLLKRRIEAALRAGDDPLFVFRSDKKTEYGNVVFVLDELKNAGVKRLSIATERKDQ